MVERLWKGIGCGGRARRPNAMDAKGPPRQQLLASPRIQDRIIPQASVHVFACFIGLARAKHRDELLCVLCTLFEVARVYPVLERPKAWEDHLTASARCEVLWHATYFGVPKFVSSTSEHLC